MAIYVYNNIEPPFEREHEYTYTWSDQVLTIPRNWKYFLETKGAGSNSGAWGLATAYFNLREWDKLAVMVWQKGWANTVTYGFGGRSNYSWGGWWAGLTGFFTGESTILATDSTRALIIGWGAGGTIKSGDGGAGWGTTWANGFSSSWYGTAGWGGTQTGRGTWWNAGANQFNGWDGSGTYGAGWGGWRRWGNGSKWDSSDADDKGAGWGSGYISSEWMDGTNTQWGWSGKNTDGRAKITFIEDWIPDTWYHIPTWQELTNLKSIMDWLSLKNRNDYKEKLHMPLVGTRRYTDLSTIGYWESLSYWSSSTYWSTNPEDVVDLSIDSSSVAIGRCSPSFGLPVRCFCGSYIKPDNTRTIEAWTLWWAWIFHNADLGVISLTNGGNTNITIRDKNVWATIVYNSWDTLTDSNCGKIFQWWNYNWFDILTTIDNTSNTTVDTTWYGWDNPYSSNVFIVNKYEWSSPRNENLRTDSKEEYFVIE